MFLAKGNTMQYTVPFSEELIRDIIEEVGTPVHIIDERGVRETARKLYKAFSWAPGFKNFYAVKANPNPHLLRVLAEEGMGADCSSMTELVKAGLAGITGENIMFSSNNTARGEFAKAVELGAIINLDDINMIDFLEKEAGIPEVICFRYNPGPLQKGTKFFGGNPEEQKYGAMKEQLFEAYQIMAEKGVKRFGIHTMFHSNCLQAEKFVGIAEMLYDFIFEMGRDYGIRFDFANHGGGMGIPYDLDDEPLDVNKVSSGMQRAYDEKIIGRGLDPVNIYFENGRMITGPHGYLVSEVIHKKEIYRDYIGLDACMVDNPRPAMYGAYHHISILGKENEPQNHVCDVVGSLCENNDKFAIQRALPKTALGDIAILHNDGAHTEAMGSNYNDKPRSPQVLVPLDGGFKVIKRRETIEDLLRRYMPLD